MESRLHFGTATVPRGDSLFTVNRGRKRVCQEALKLRQMAKKKGREVEKFK